MTSGTTVTSTSVIEIKGSPYGAIAWLLTVLIITAILMTNFISAGRINTDIDRASLGAIVVIALAVSVFLARKVVTLRGTVVTLSPEGFQDRRVASCAMPWASIVRLSIVSSRTIGRRSRRSMRLFLKPDYERTADFQAAVGLTYKLRSALRAKSFTVSAQGLQISSDSLIEMTTAYRKTAIDRMEPVEKGAMIAEPVDKTLLHLQAISRKIPLFTLGLLAVLVIVFALEVGLASRQLPIGHTSEILPRDLLLDGGMNRPLVDDGQWWRFFSAPLLHVNFTHLLMNGIGLIFSGYLLERLIGWRWYGGIFAFAALTGGLASHLSNPANLVSVGASGGIVGLFAAALILAWHYPDGVLRTRMLMGALRVLVPTLIPQIASHGALNIDVAAHIGGAIGGAVIGLALLGLWHKDHDIPKFAIFPTVLTAAFMIGSATAFAFAGQYRSTMNALDPALPQPFQRLVERSADLIAEYPRDPRVRYARSAALYDGNHPDEARQLLEATLADRTMLKVTPKVETPTRALLGVIDEAEGKHDLAKSVVAPICETKEAAVRDFISGLCK